MRLLLQEYFKLRSLAIEKMKSAGENPYPHKFHVSMSLENFIKEFSEKLQDGETNKEVTHSIAGRVHAIRRAGNKLLFIDLRGEGFKVQVLANANLYGNQEEFLNDVEKIGRGDIIGVIGHPGKSKKGEFSIVPDKIELLTPCLHMLPHLHFGLKDKVGYFWNFVFNFNNF